MGQQGFLLENDQFAISASKAGAELQSIYDKRQSLEILWQGDSQYWGRRAPILFPIVGRLKDDKLIHHNQAYSMTQHGFARDSEFELLYHDDTQLEFRLKSDAESLQHYPFTFELIISYVLENNIFTINHVIRSGAENDLPFSIGGHPAFNWPLIAGVDKTQHYIEFECTDTNHIRQLKGGLLMPERIVSPVKEHKLALNDDLFANDALIFDDLKNRVVSYRAGEKYALKFRFQDFPQFGLWTKPGAPFVCLEPWYGYASPVDFDGEFSIKPGILRLPAHGEVQLAYSIEFINQPA